MHLRIIIHKFLFVQNQICFSSFRWWHLFVD